MEKKRYTLWILVLSLPFWLTAQDKWQGTFFLGGANYMGDLNPTVYPYPAETNLALGLTLRYALTNQLGIRLGATYGQLSGDDANFDEPGFSEERRFSFRTDLAEAALLLEWEPFGNRRYRSDSIKFKKIISPFVFAGGSLAIYNPQVKFADYQNGEAPLEVQKDRAIKLPQQNLGIPVGGGIKIDVSRKVLIGVEGGLRFAFSDYLDGVSQAANPEFGDYYLFAGATLTIRLRPNDEDEDGIPDKKDRCPVIPGSFSAQGCPDRDGDGVEDSEDLCPDQNGVKVLGGCPDYDNDGIADQDDRCPGGWGPECTGGCPDMDEDCISDGIDACPDICGVDYADGCPDTDGDKIQDSEDWCPLLPGESWKGGCPLMDTNGDGVADEKSIFQEVQLNATWHSVWKKIEVPHQVIRASIRGMLVPGYLEKNN